MKASSKQIPSMRYVALSVPCDCTLVKDIQAGVDTAIEAVGIPATFELCQIADKNSTEALIQKKIIDDVMHE